MANSNINSTQEDRSASAAEWFKPDSRWTLLFVGNRGKPIRLKRFKGIVLLTFFTTCLLIALAVSLYWWNRSILDEKTVLESQLTNLKKQNQELRYEKDILLTRLVVAESRTLEKQGDAPEIQYEKQPPGQTEQETNDARPSLPSAVTTTMNEAPNQVNAQPEGESTGAVLKVAIENFKYSVTPGKNSVRIQFKLKNTSPDSRPVSGHAIVVLKGEEIEENQWVSLPGIPLIQGKPTGKQQGYAFGIRNFKIMTFKLSKSHSPERFQTASIFVFDKTGELLLEQDFPVKPSQ